MNILRAHHVAIICSDYERSKRFYTEVLGLEVVAEVYRAERDSHKLDLRLPDGTQVELFSFPDPPPRPSYPEACGLRHVAFEVEDVEVAARHLQGHGVAVEPVRVDEFTGKRFTFFSDPDGLPLELYESDLPDAALLAGFEAGTLAPSQFGHRSHVRVAYLVVVRDGPADALSVVRAGLRRLNTAHGSPDTLTRGYHETVTCAFLRLIGPLAGAARHDSFEAFCAAHPWLLDRPVLGRFYSPGRLWSADAKRAFVDPDLAPLGPPGSAGGA